MFGESLGGEGKEYQVLQKKNLITKTKLQKNYKKKKKLILVIDFF
jgi:hypothetical protein